VQFVSSAAVPYFLPLVKYQLSYTRIHACHSDTLPSCFLTAFSRFSIVQWIFKLSQWWPPSTVFDCLFEVL